MAYHTRGRDPLIDSTMQAAIERRGKELVGLGLIAAGLLGAVMLASYTPEDPNWLLASDAPVQNWLGRFGASLSHPLMMIVGKAAWLLPLILGVWGLRFAGHWGEDRALGRAVVGPIAVALGALYAATLAPGPDWPPGFGMGGLFGDMVLSIVLSVLPLGAGFGAKLMSLLAGLAMLGGLAYALGFTNRELKLGLRWGLYGLILAYDFMLKMGGKTAVVSMKVAQGAQDRVADRMAQRRAEAEQERQRLAEEEAAERLVPPPAAAERARVASVVRARAVAQPELEEDDWAEARALAAVPAAAPASFAAPMRPQAQPAASQPRAPRVPPPVTGDGAGRKMPPMAGQQTAAPAAQGGLVAPVRAETRAPEPEPAARRFLGTFFNRTESDRRTTPSEIPAAPADPLIDLPDGDRIRARISDAVRARRTVETPAPPPPVARPRGPRPLILDTTPRTAPRAEDRVENRSGPRTAEPPMTARPTDRSGLRTAEPPLTSITAKAPVPHAAPLLRATPVAVPVEPAFQLPAAPQDWEAPIGEDDLLDEGGVWQDVTSTAAPVVEPVRAAPPTAASRPGPSVGTASRAADTTAHIAAPSAPAVPRLPAAEPRRAVVQPTPPRAAPSSRARAEAQPVLPLEDPYANYETPPLHLLADPAEIERHHLSNEALEENARMLESVLDDYGVKGEIVSVRPGPVVTMYELEPAPGLKASRVIGLADDIARSMSALSARVSTVPGRSVIGIELPNVNREKVVLREILSARDFGDSQQKLPLALGKDIAGEPVVANLAKMPHLLIAGTTGSGKSVAINTMILSLLYRLTPAECRLIMIDPKMLELSVYDGIPHLLSPVVTDPKKAVVALKWVVGEMEERYRKMSKMGVRNIDGYNGRVKEALARGETFDRTVQTGFDDETGDPIFETEEIFPVTMPYIVVVVDEMADLMMVAGKEIEACIQRLAQMARASGIHLIMATQRPSVDVITGTIKANFPTRISFQVTSKIDSRTILGEQGAEQLLGMGDMLYMAGGGRVNRVHGPFCSDEEVEEIVSFLKGFGPPEYVSGVVEGPEEGAESDIDAVLGLGGDGATGEDALYDQAVQIAARDRKCSTSYIQRKLAIGYNKAARLVEQMEDQGVVSAANHVGKREVLVPEVH